jgi:hypothetical protein
MYFLYIVSFNINVYQLVHVKRELLPHGETNDQQSSKGPRRRSIMSVYVSELS